MTIAGKSTASSRAMASAPTSGQTITSLPTMRLASSAPAQPVAVSRSFALKMSTPWLLCELVSNGTVMQRRATPRAVEPCRSSRTAHYSEVKARRETRAERE